MCATGFPQKKPVLFNDHEKKASRIQAKIAGIGEFLFPTGGFLGGDFEKGFSQALIAVSNLAITVIIPRRDHKIPAPST